MAQCSFITSRQTSTCIFLLQMVLRHNVSAHFSSTGPRSQHAHVAEAGAGMGPDKVVHAELDPGMDPDRDDTASDEDYDTDLELEDVQKSYDPSGQECYKSACKGFGVVPVSYFLRHMHASELTMMHHGLGPQVRGTRALAVPLVTNTSILKLNLRDNWMEGTGGVAMAEMLRENCYITGAWHIGSSSPCTRLHLSLISFKLLLCESSHMHMYLSRPG
uniref:Uncharacterized protein n=1 Tax=Scleropages formosus TaxID=113540 RepID=A0A8D0CH93_SCLFO